MALFLCIIRDPCCADEMKDGGGRWHSVGRGGGRRKDRQKGRVRGQNARERKRGREKIGGTEGVGEGRRGNGIVMSLASSSSDPQSREFVRRMRAGTPHHGEIKS